MCNVAFVLVALLSSIAVHAAPTARSSAWNVVTDAAQASMALPTMSTSRDASTFTVSDSSAAQQAQSAQQLAMQHDATGQQPEAAGSPTTIMMSTYDLCRSQYPEFVPTVVAAPAAASDSTGRPSNGPTTNPGTTTPAQPNTPQQPTNPGQTTDPRAQQPAVNTPTNRSPTPSQPTSNPSTPSNNPSTYACNANTQNWLDTCDFCTKNPADMMCTKFKPAPGQCASLKAACPTYTPKPVPAGYTPAARASSRRRQAPSADTMYNTYNTAAGGNNNAPGAQPAYNSGQQAEQPLNAMMCQQVLNAPTYK